MKPVIYLASLLVIIYQFHGYLSAKELINADSISENREFSVDYEHNTFLMDGKPFRFIAGAFHYYRALPERWQLKLRTMRAAGLNVVTTYVEWSLHNPKDGVYNWEGIANLEEFIRLAVKEDLYVILRPGPYICAERDMGGFPYWLLHKYPGIILRTNDINYIREVRLWYQQLMPKIEPYLYGNGGPIIMVQVENEYGSYFTCNKAYQNWLRDETERYVQGKAVLFTNDGPVQVKCGKIKDVLATLDFGPSNQIDDYWKILRQYQPNGPLVNIEFYPGWLTHWQEAMQRINTKPITDSLRTMLNANVSVNLYMFFGGTNFGFTAGANDGGPGSFNPDVTSYDYDAPMDESGDPTPKYMAIREVVGQYLPLPNISVPEKAPKMNFGPVKLNPLSILISNFTKKYLGSDPIFSKHPLTFEQLNQYSGFILYETELPRFTRDPSILKIDKLRDRAHIIVDRTLIGILSRENKIDSIGLSAGDLGDRLQIIVENQGRINFNQINDFKGIVGDVRLNGVPLLNWTIIGYPLDDYEKIDNLIKVFADEQQNNAPRNLTNKAFLKAGPTIFHGEFNINEHPIYDTYLDPTGWGKGIAMINGFNLGRYWPTIGPQITLYVPKEILKIGRNEMVLIELQKSPDNGTVVLVDTPNLDGYK